MSNFDREHRIAEALARAAGRRMVRERGEGFSVEWKGENDPVTEVDLSIERFLTEELDALFPADRIYGEELEADPADGTDRTWLIDPIDGTQNFSSGLPLFCVSIALTVDGRSVVGVVYDPTRDELFSAQRGDGAFLDERPLEVSDTETIDDAVLVTGFPRSVEDGMVDNLRNFETLTRETRGVRRLGSAALDLAYVAAGRLDGFWEYHLAPWDTAAGYLLVDEAGGRTSDTAGREYHPDRDSILASNGTLHEALVERLTSL
ncbi:MAG: inositol monophosphatase [Bradymonadaceae bacterium]